jgi:hypothetical protein
VQNDCERAEKENCQNGDSVLASPPAPPRWQLQQLGRLDIEDGGELADDLQARIERALLKLAQVAAAYLGFIGEIVLRQPFVVPQAV